MIKIVGIEFIPRLGNGRPENGTGTFVEALMYPALSSPVKTLRPSTLSSSTDSSGIRTVIAVIDWENLLSWRWIPFA